MWWILLRILPFRSLLGLVLSVAQFAALVAVGVMAAYWLGYDPVSVMWQVVVDVVEAAVEQAVGDALP